MKNNELVEHLLENHWVRILIKKNGVTSHELNGCPMKKSGSSKKQKGREGGKKKDNSEMDETNAVERDDT